MSVIIYLLFYYAVFFFSIKKINRFLLYFVCKDVSVQFFCLLSSMHQFISNKTLRAGIFLLLSYKCSISVIIPCNYRVYIHIYLHKYIYIYAMRYISWHVSWIVYIYIYIYTCILHIYNCKVNAEIEHLIRQKQIIACP